MRRSVRDQLPLVPVPFGHEHVRELQAARTILDAHPEFARWVQADLLAGGIDAGRGRAGMSGEQVLRALVIKRQTGSATRSSRSTWPTPRATARSVSSDSPTSRPRSRRCNATSSRYVPKPSSVSTGCSSPMHSSTRSKTGAACAAMPLWSRPRSTSRLIRAYWSTACAY
jgi:hypothetical protein